MELTCLWLVIWTLHGLFSRAGWTTPHPWNAWLIALIVMFAIDIFGGEKKT